MTKLINMQICLMLAEITMDLRRYLTVCTYVPCVGVFCLRDQMGCFSNCHKFHTK